jgi:hypothetical protein
MRPNTSRHNILNAETLLQSHTGTSANLLEELRTTLEVEPQQDPYFLATIERLLHSFQTSLDQKDPQLIINLKKHWRGIILVVLGKLTATKEQKLHSYNLVLSIISHTNNLKMTRFRLTPREYEKSQRTGIGSLMAHAFTYNIATSTSRRQIYLNFITSLTNRSPGNNFLDHSNPFATWFRNSIRKIHGKKENANHILSNINNSEAEINPALLTTLYNVKTYYLCIIMLLNYFLELFHKMIENFAEREITDIESENIDILKKEIQALSNAYDSYSFNLDTALRQRYKGELDKMVIFKIITIKKRNNVGDVGQTNTTNPVMFSKRRRDERTEGENLTVKRRYSGGTTKSEVDDLADQLKSVGTLNK